MGGVKFPMELVHGQRSWKLGQATRDGKLAAAHEIEEEPSKLWNRMGLESLTVAELQTGFRLTLCGR
jgi:hypothetical protein